MLTLIDLFIILIAAIVWTFAHSPAGYTIIVTLVVLIVVRLLGGERIVTTRSTTPA